MDKVPMDPEGPPFGEDEGWPPKKQPEKDPGGEEIEWDPNQPRPKVQPKPLEF
jgi:hypothetical protein